MKDAMTAMKMCCPLCDETVAMGGFRASEDGIELRCSACRGEFSVSLAGAVTLRASRSSERQQPAAGEMRCPKCLQLQPERDACRECGLQARRFKDYSSPDAAQASAELQALWARLQQDWDDDSRHDAFVEAAAQDGQFAYAARCYRGTDEQRPGDPQARLRMERLTRMAEAALLVGADTRNPAPLANKQPYRGVILLFIGLLLLALVGVAYMVFKGPNGAAQPAVPVLPGQPGQRRIVPGQAPGLRRPPARGLQLPRSPAKPSKPAKRGP